jgi:hypothetical protein
MTTAALPAQGDDSRYRAYGFLMLEEPINPRNISMGSVGTALCGAGFRYYNPAMPFFSSVSFVTAEFGRIPGELDKGGFEAAQVFSDWFTAISFQSNSVNFETRDERGFGSTATSSTTFGATTAGYIRDNFALGLSFNVAEDRIWIDGNYGAMTLSIGAGYKLFDDRLNIGAALFNYIAWSRGIGENPDKWSYDKELVPRFARAGAAWTDTLKSLPYTVAADVAYRDNSGTFSLPIGIEVRVLPYLSLRMGKRFGWENEVMSFGIGFNIEQLSFDVAFVPTVFVRDYEMKWSMAFGYSLGQRRAPSRPSSEAQKSSTLVEPPMAVEKLPEPEEPLELPDAKDLPIETEKKLPDIVDDDGLTKLPSVDLPVEAEEELPDIIVDDDGLIESPSVEDLPVEAGEELPNVVDDELTELQSIEDLPLEVGEELPDIVVDDDRLTE